MKNQSNELLSGIDKNLNIPNLTIYDYDYNLSDERIAQFPLEDRSSSKLIRAEVKMSTISHHIFKEIPVLLPKDSLLVLNSSRVIAARINMQKSTGGKVEILCIEPIYPVIDPSLAMNEKPGCVWKCIIGGKNIREKMILYPANGDNKYVFKAEVMERFDNMANVRFLWLDDTLSFANILDIFGVMPLPPYIHRESTNSDKFTYQTVYAAHNGSVAAPTAGLHFDNNILKDICDKNIEIAEIVLHVGPGTFQPVTSEFISAHIMHSEQINIAIKTLLRIKDKVINGSSIIAVGTTSLRTLESLYWIGIKIINRHNDIFTNNHFFLNQWEPYKLSNSAKGFTCADSIDAIIEYLMKKNIPTLNGYTQLLIIPGYEFKIVDTLLTNFHLPRSTLLMLVAAFVGDDFWKKIYYEALKNNYRFLSYGDASLLFR